MAKITDVGPFAYVQRLYWTLENPPLWHLDVTNEIEYPFRRGRCLVLRVPFTKRAFAVGLWGERQAEQEALLAAMGGRITRNNGVVLDELEGW